MLKNQQRKQERPSEYHFEDDNEVWLIADWTKLANNEPFQENECVDGDDDELVCMFKQVMSCHLPNIDALVNELEDDSFHDTNSNNGVSDLWTVLGPRGFLFVDPTGIVDSSYKVSNAPSCYSLLTEEGSQAFDLLTLPPIAPNVTIQDRVSSIIPEQKQNVRQKISKSVSKKVRQDKKDNINKVIHR